MHLADTSVKGVAAPWWDVKGCCEGHQAGTKVFILALGNNRDVDLWLLP
jgi:hypothetical protein